MTRSVWRYIPSPPADGPTNMAIDEAILSAVAAGESPPTVRVYAWKPPCLSLGYFQQLAEVDVAACVRRGVPVVRRATGGSAILHADELTYSITARESDPHVRGVVLASYQSIALVLVEALSRLGVEATLAPLTGNPGPPVEPKSAGRRPTPCFLRPAGHEVIAGGRKLIGSAQMRRGGALLQHGALPLGGDPGEICSLLAMPPAARKAAGIRLRQRAITLEEAAGRPVSLADASAALVDAFAELWGVQLVPGALSAAEVTAAAASRQNRYFDLAAGR